MRRAVLIIAALLSALPGGPSRCACRFFILLPTPQVTNSPADRSAEGNTKRACKHSVCSCTHGEQTATSEVTPIKGRPVHGTPCEHCPFLDVAPQIGDRSASLIDVDDVQDRFCYLALPPFEPESRSLALDERWGRATFQNERLKFCYAFRC